MTAGYLERLAERSAAVGSVLCLGLDPDPAGLPPGFSRDLAGIEAFARLIVEAAAPYAAAVKPNLAFFEAYGSAGMAALERIRAAIPSDVLVVADAKRGDIGTTAARQAVALFDGLGADAVTVNPYLGSEAVTPLIERLDRFAYLLCRTSNPGAGELQDLDVAPAPLAGRAGGTALGPGGAPGVRLGARRDGRPRRRCDGARSSSRPIRSIAPGPGASWCRASGRRAGTSARCWPRVRPTAAPAGWATRRWTAGERLAGHRRSGGAGR